MSAVAYAPRFAVSQIFEYENRFDLCVILTLLLLLLYPDNFWYIKIPLSVIAISGFIFPRLRVSTVMWALAVIIIAAGTYRNWYIVDNHKYLLGYWCLAILVALLTDAPEHTLAKSARWLVVLVFGLALVHKTLSVDYLNGTFFHYELLFDERFSGLARYVGGMPEHMQHINEAARRALVSYDSTLASVQVRGTAATARLGTFITWWNYVIQVVIAVAFLLPRATWFARMRHVWLLLFLYTTYLFAPVIGFGWVLATMGISQTDRDEIRTRVLYVVAFLVLQVYRAPWSLVLASITGADAR